MITSILVILSLAGFGYWIAKEVIADEPRAGVVAFRIGAGILGTVAVGILSTAFVIIDGGTRGVVKHLGAYEDKVLGEGFHFL